MDGSQLTALLLGIIMAIGPRIRRGLAGGGRAAVYAEGGLLRGPARHQGREARSVRLADLRKGIVLQARSDHHRVRSDDETVVTDDYKPRNNRFTGALGKIVVEVR